MKDAIAEAQTTDDFKALFECTVEQWRDLSPCWQYNEVCAFRDNGGELGFLAYEEPHDDDDDLDLFVCTEGFRSYVIDVQSVYINLEIMENTIEIEELLSLGWNDEEIARLENHIKENNIKIEIERE
jgi:hypothetical protein